MTPQEKLKELRDSMIKYPETLVADIDRHPEALAEWNKYMALCKNFRAYNARWLGKHKPGGVKVIPKSISLERIQLVNVYLSWLNQEILSKADKIIALWPDEFWKNILMQRAYLPEIGHIQTILKYYTEGFLLTPSFEFRQLTLKAQQQLISESKSREDLEKLETVAGRKEATKKPPKPQKAPRIKDMIKGIQKLEGRSYAPTI